ncbi:hypothetical protein AAG570_006991 [Ranatra chinensis]|uniref:Integrase catalytic domain-containing protein n=1 Tax=Ranatra chinensis TaxID=642074 RepID=A0ABD0YXU6_9HEMI
MLHLRRRYYWPKTTKMMVEELAPCEVCARPKGDSQMVTPTSEKPLEVIEADLVFLDGAIRLTLIDRLTRFAYNYPLQAKTGKRISEGLLLFLTTVGTPRTLVLDRGREFDNFLVRSLLEEFRVKVHWTTPGHSRSHGMIQRLHGTLQEHLHILRIGRGMTGGGRVGMGTASLQQFPPLGHRIYPLGINTGLAARGLPCTH